MAAISVNGARGEDSHSEDDESQRRENIQQIALGKKMGDKGATSASRSRLQEERHEDDKIEDAGGI
jgi:hypothetical protein